jgi:hypothetical protein
MKNPSISLAMGYGEKRCQVCHLNRVDVIAEGGKLPNTEVCKPCAVDAIRKLVAGVPSVKEFTVHETISYVVKATSAQEALDLFRKPNSGPYAHNVNESHNIVGWKVFDLDGNEHDTEVT